MTYQLERAALEIYTRAIWPGVLGFDGQTFTPVNDSVMMTIQSGAVLQGSTGRTLNQKLHIGTLTLAIYTDGAKGSAAWRGYAETLINGLREKRLASTGLLAGANDVFIRFSAPQLSPNEHPYVGASFKDAPFMITNIIAPFVRYSYS